ncbi:DUF5357 family protein [Moorena bouillonii]|uniref:DUF5357 domain-containing protein n=1 Tax=Moorena bouillonii PNG TaxID=568701 RepID=A0A1U7N2W9_9CYAN|nr:DUF5357 family protein [Moorena bouillonii]OLT60297.1 hypothetical protein BJP37_15950 [Moorena bouillonii PNG]
MKFFTSFFEFVIGLAVVDWVVKVLKPPKAFSWQAIMWLTVFSYVMAGLATGFVQRLIASCGGIFFILFVYWVTAAAAKLRIAKKSLPLGAWITGALTSIYLFGISWNVGEYQLRIDGISTYLLGIDSGELSSLTFISLPLISAIIAALPYILAVEFKVKKPSPAERQYLVILFGSQLLISCWIQFYFVIQNWLVQYPSLLSDDFIHSSFVWKLPSAQVTVLSRGVSILEGMEVQLKEELNEKSWSEVEKSLLKVNHKKLLKGIEYQAKQNSPVAEDPLWKVTYKFSSRESGSDYNLDLQANWNGPRSNPDTKPDSYSFTKSCRIKQVDGLSGLGSQPIGNVQCQPSRAGEIEVFADQGKR